MRVVAVHPNDVVLKMDELLLNQQVPAETDTMIATTLSMLDACRSTGDDAPTMTAMPVGVPGLTSFIVEHEEARLGLMAPVAVPMSKGRIDPEPILSLILRACRISERYAQRPDEANRFLRSIHETALIGTVAVAAGATRGGRGSMVHGPSPFGDARLCVDDMIVDRSAAFPSELPRGWIIGTTDGLNGADAAIVLSGVTYEPDPDEPMDVMEAMREIERLRLAPMIEAMTRP
jgi:hypothetical protein